MYFTPTVINNETTRPLNLLVSTIDYEPINLGILCGRHQVVRLRPPEGNRGYPGEEWEEIGRDTGPWRIVLTERHKGPKRVPLWTKYDQRAGRLGFRNPMVNERESFHRINYIRRKDESQTWEICYLWIIKEWYVKETKRLTLTYQVLSARLTGETTTSSDENGDLKPLQAPE